MKKYLFFLLGVLFAQQCYSLTLVNFSLHNQMQLGYLDGIQCKVIPLMYGNRVQFNHQGDFYIKVTFAAQGNNRFDRYFFVPHNFLDPNSLYTILTGINCLTNRLNITFNNGQLPIRVVELDNPIINF